MGFDPVKWGQKLWGQFFWGEGHQIVELTIELSPAQETVDLAVGTEIIELEGE